MPRGCDYSVHVRLEQRHFIVEYDSDGKVLRIKERKPNGPPSGTSSDVSWWVATSHPLGNGNTLPKRVIAAALAKQQAEHRADLATP
jgi:hypothetical protein